MSHPKRLHIFVLIDGLGWKILESQEFLSDLLSFRIPLRTVLGYSAGAIPTIVTGRPPAEHGHWNLFYYDPEGSPFGWLTYFRFLPESVLNHRVTRKLVKEMGRRVLGLGPLFECCVSPRLLPYFNWVEKRNIYARGGIAGAPSIFDQLDETSVPHRVYTYHRWSDEEIIEQTQRDLNTGEANFFFLYLCELDLFLHNHCQDKDLVSEKLKYYASSLRRVFELALKRDPEARLAVCSDHGMTPVKNSYDLTAEVARLGFSMPSDFLAVYDSTMARFWFFNDRARREIVQHLNAIPCGRILSDEELERLGVLFPDRRYGELVLLFHPGWLLASSDFNDARWSPSGMHGYHPDDPYSDGIFLSNREPSIPVRAIADVYECMRRAAGLRL